MDQTTQTFNAANDYLRGRVNVLNNMSSRELSATLLPEIRAQAFFSARVAEANVLEAIRGISDKYSSGEKNLAEARTEIKQFLFGKGFTPDDVSRQKEPPAGISPEKWQEAKQVTNLASTARTNLILKQNANMAYAVGQREVSMDPDILERWPYFRYITGPNPRPEHEALDGLVLRKDDPFWNTHTPPWDFNCNCVLEDCDEEEAKQYGGVAKVAQSGESSFKVDNNGRFVNVDVPESGYVFDVNSALSTCDMSRIDSPDMRSAIFAKLEELGKDKTMSFRCIPQFAPMAEAAVTGMPEISKVSDAVAKFASGAGIDATGVKLGKISAALRTSTGMPEGILKLSEGNKNFYGFKHAEIHHAAEMADGRFLQAINETVYASGGKIRTSIEFRGGRKYLRLINLLNGSYTAFVEVKPNEWELVQAFTESAGYEAKMSVNRAKRKAATVTGT